MKLLILVLTMAVTVTVHGITPGVVSCPSSGNKVILSSHHPTNNFTLFAPGSTNSPANTGVVYFGDQTVTTSTGFPLVPGASYTAPARGTASPYDLGSVYAACSVNTDILIYVYY